MDSLPQDPGRVEQLARLAGFRRELHECFTARADALFELCDAVLCAQGPVRSAAELSLEPEFRRGHGSVYDALAGGQIDTGRLRRLQVAAMTPAAAGDPLMFGIDVTPLARPDAVFADELVMVQVRGAGGDRYLPGWPLSVLVGVGWGPPRGWMRSRPGGCARERTTSMPPSRRSPICSATWPPPAGGGQPARRRW